MKLRYVEVKNNDIIVFKLPEKQFEYSIAIISNGIFCTFVGGCNSAIFNYLGLNAKDFVQNIVGYKCDGLWPIVKSVNDFKKVIKALDDECIKKFGKSGITKFNDCTWDPKALELVNENVVKVDYATEFEAELNLFPTKKHYQLNFNY